MKLKNNMKKKNMVLSENKIRPDVFSKKQEKLYQEDVEDLLKHKRRFVKVGCPACGKTDNKKWGTKYTLNYVACDNCGTVFINPRPTPEILSEYYKNSKNYVFWNKFIFPRSEKARIENIFKPRVNIIKELCLKNNIDHEVLVEVGAGFGTFCGEMKKAGLFKRIIAIEPTPDLAATCRKRGLEGIEKRIEDVKLNIPIDVVASFEVIEHLFSPKDFLVDCAHSLKKGGAIILSCPNIQGFDLVMLRELSKSIDAEHLNYFNPNSLKHLLEQCGFKIIETLTPGRLDAELVRKAVIAGKFDISKHSFLKQVLIDEWERLGDPFQQFLSDNLLSSHLLIIAKKI